MRTPAGELLQSDLPRPDRLREALSHLLPWFAGHRRSFPWREERDPYRVWISEIMLQQTRIEAVLGYYDRFLTAFPTLPDLARAKEEQVLKLWEGLGYYSRARNLHKAAEKCLAEYGGRLPESFALLKKLPGLGEYTAGAVASFCFSEPVSAVDGNVLRVLSRLWASEEDVLAPAARKEAATAIEHLLREDPVRFPAGAVNEALMELGETLCAPAGEPACGECPWRELCLAHAAGREEELPYRSKAAPRKIEEKTVLLLRRGDKTALRRRPEGGLLAGLYEFPCLEGFAGEEALRRLYPQALSLRPLGPARHIFTHIEWHMQGCELLLPPEAEAGDCLFLTREEILDRYPLPAAFRRYKELL